MPKKDRDTLKNYFQSGSLPTQGQFENLIDSMLNKLSDGFDNTAPDGFKLAQLRGAKLASFFEDIAIRSPIWSLQIDIRGGTRNLSFLNQEEKPVLTLDPQGKVGINNNRPQFELDVDGIVACRGRIGHAGLKNVHANGLWQDITDTLEGCQALEVVAGVGRPKSGKYALVHAFALKTFGARGKIVYHQANYGSRCNRIRLRWRKRPGKRFVLQLKTACCYGEKGRKYRPQEGEDKSQTDVGIYVKYYLTELWLDHKMAECTFKEPENAP
jgi:hypothetical protein